MNKKFISSVTGASIFLVIIAICSKGLGFIREIIFANYFGLSKQFDIYLIGAVLPLTINTIISYLGQNYLIPAYNKIKENDPDAVENFIQMNFLIFIFGGFILAAILYLSSDVIIGFYLHSANTEVIGITKIIFSIFLISMPISSASSVITAYQQIHFEFKHPAYSQLLSSVTLIILLIIFRDTLGIYIIPIGFVVGSFLQLIYLIKKSNLRLKLNLPFKSFKEYKKFIPNTLLIIILIESIGQLYMLVDRYFYSSVPTGGIASLNYAQIVFLLPISILSIALSTAIFPKFSQFISKNLMNELENNFNEGIRVNVVLFVPIMLLFFFYGDFILRIFFERGKFTFSDTIITYHVLIFYSISIVFYSVYSIENKLLYGLGLIKGLLYITVAGIFIKIVLNILLVRSLEQNGLALSTSISYLFFFIASLILINMKIKIKNKTVFLSESIFNLSNGLISLLIAKQISGLFPSNGLFLLFEMVLFLVFYFTNVFLVKHSSTKILYRVINSFK